MVSAEYELNCTAVRSNVQLMRDTLDQRGIVRAGDFDATFAGLPVLVLDQPHLADLGDDNYLMGTYDLSGITLARDTTGWLHELLHHLDRLRLDPLSASHTGWGGRGWNAASDAYELAQASPRDDRDCVLEWSTTTATASTLWRARVGWGSCELVNETFDGVQLSHSEGTGVPCVVEGYSRLGDRLTRDGAFEWPAHVRMTCNARPVLQ